MKHPHQEEALLGIVACCFEQITPAGHVHGAALLFGSMLPGSIVPMSMIVCWPVYLKLWNVRWLAIGTTRLQAR